MFGMQGVPPNNYTQLEYRDRLEKCGESLFHKSNSEPRIFPMAVVQKTVRRIVSTTKTAQPLAPYSKGIQVDNTLYVSGQIGLDPTTGEFTGEDVESQTKQCMLNLGSVLEAGGSSFNNVIKTTVLMTDIADYGKVNDIYASYFPKVKPARSAFAVKGLPKNAKIEIEAIAIVGELSDE